MCKSRRKLRNAKILPLEVPILLIIFSMSFYGQFRQLFHISEPILSKQFFSKLEFLFSVLGSMVSKHICKLRHKLKNSKIYPNSLGHDQINLDIRLFVLLQAKLPSQSGFFQKCNFLIFSCAAVNALWGEVEISPSLGNPRRHLCAAVLDVVFDLFESVIFPLPGKPKPPASCLLPLLYLLPLQEEDTSHHLPTDSVWTCDTQYEVFPSSRPSSSCGNVCQVWSRHFIVYVAS